MGRRYVKRGYTTRDEWTGPDHHVHVGHSRRRVGGGEALPAKKAAQAASAIKAQLGKKKEDLLGLSMATKAAKKKAATKKTLKKKAKKLALKKKSAKVAAVKKGLKM